MLSIPIYHRRNTNQNDNKKSNSIWENGYLDCMQTVNEGKSWEMMESPYTFPRNRHWQQPLERTACTGQKKNFKRTKPRTFVPTPGPILQKNHHSKWHMQPNVHSSATSNNQDRPKKWSMDRLNLKEMWCIYIQWAITQTRKTATEIMKSCKWFPQGWTLVDHTPSEVRNRKKIAGNFLGKI